MFIETEMLLRFWSRPHTYSQTQCKCCSIVGRDIEASVFAASIKLHQTMANYQHPLPFISFSLKYNYQSVLVAIRVIDKVIYLEAGFYFTVSLFSPFHIFRLMSLLSFLMRLPSSSHKDSRITSVCLCVSCLHFL